MTGNCHSKRGRGALWAGIALLAACTNTIPPRDPEYAATRPAAPATSMVEATGSIYQAGNGLSLFEDPKARRVGDVLTIHLVESTNASKSASTSTKKQDNVQIADPMLFGTSVVWNAPQRAPFANKQNLNLSATLNSDQQFKGDAGSSQKNSLTGDLSVTVAEVLANGNLVVRGEKQIGINQGSEQVQLSGIVRPQDIQADNSVLSTQVADARISYGGKGALADANSHGWLTRFFLSPWWPF